MQLLSYFHSLYDKIKRELYVVFHIMETGGFFYRFVLYILSSERVYIVNFNYLSNRMVAVPKPW